MTSLTAPSIEEDVCVPGADSPAVLAVLGDRGAVGPNRLERTVAAAELDPSRPRGGGTPSVGIRGVTPVAERMERAGLDLVVRSKTGAAAVAECPRTTAVGTAEDVVDILPSRYEPEEPPARRPDGPTDPPGPIWGIADETLRALEIACAGGHHMHLVGEPGRDWPARYGLVAQRMLLDLDPERSRETNRPLPPARAPLLAVRGGGDRAPAVGRRGEPRAHGLLLMDEPAEFDCGAFAAAMAIPVQSVNEVSGERVCDAVRVRPALAPDLSGRTSQCA